MTNGMSELPESARWRLMVDAAKKGAEAAGYKLTRVPGRGLSNVWTLEMNGKKQLTAIRTTRDRWLAFPPLQGGKKWKTLDDVDLVVVATVDAKEDPKQVEVYILPAKHVREHFNTALAARAKAGYKNLDNFGMWVGLDPDPRGIATSVGSGIIKNYKPVAVYAIEPLIAAAKAGQATSVEENEAAPGDAGGSEHRDEPATIADVMSWARQRVAEIAGVGVQAVKLDLRVEY